MSFATPMFLWVFLPALLLTYWLLPARWRGGVVSAASMLFYTWGGGPFIALLLGCIAVNFVVGIAVAAPQRSQAWRRRLLLLAVGFDLGVLAVWKYADFASRQVHALADVLGAGSTPVVSLALPIGISFFTFHHISYIVDVYRGSKPAQRNLLRFVTYIAMFPQLIAGPIVRYHEISDQLDDVPRHRVDDFVAGFPRFALGLAKKVVVADTVAPIADAGFATGAPLTTATAWVAALAYTMQIYFDFSGYSDMAIGLARMLGFTFPENFARPYSAVSITDFWRRWHMSLSRWFRDYVYIPLGGNRRGGARTYLNLLVVFVLTGFWHGAAWTFLAWGLYHGAWLVVERASGYGRSDSARLEWLRRPVTFVIVVFGWVLFRADSIGQAAAMMKVMVVPVGGGLTDRVAVALTHERSVVLALSLLVLLMPRDVVLGRLIDAGRGARATALRLASSWVAAPLAGMLVAVGSLSPFLYFQF
ncbi:MBOAT family protein [Angustibacter sp. Root456]|uniref:MBOAT family O-acyltransferase n=1 Tax=Angustibacter sp. Root456 TaxID=1736539 RepID=UPI0006FAB472|nr:MBOAT family protein [Angustibacter sp. Root456]KQX69938.1 alginate O-acetyltransferase [Angustibacter sp. Root456]